MSRSRSLSTSSLLVALAGSGALGAAGCGDDDCGPGGAPASGLTVSSAEVSLVYGGLSALAGNDCPDPDAPAGVVSVSIEGRTADDTGLVTLCIPRPDLLMEGGRTLGTALSTADVRIFDLGGTVDGCTYALDTTRPPLGTATGTGVCSNGNDPAGFAIEIDGNVSLRRTCGPAIDLVAVALSGRVAVSLRAQ